MTVNNNSSQQPSTPSNEGGIATGVPNRTKTIGVQGNNLNNKAISTNQGNTVKQTGGGTEGTAKMDQQFLPQGNITDAKGNEQNPVETLGKQDAQQGNVNGLAGPNEITVGGNGVAAPTQQNPDDINISEFIAGSETEVKTIDEKQQARIERSNFLMKAINSMFNIERLNYTNTETGEFIGTKMRYVADAEGKTVYDYMQDPVVQEHLEFVTAEDDPRDGSPIDKQISFFWKKPTF